MNVDTADSRQLLQWEQELSEQYQKVQAQGLNLDLTRGKPSAEQLSLANDLDGILAGNYTSDCGVDTRNYGGLNGIQACRKLGGQMLGLAPEQILAGGNSSLTLMHQAMTIAYFFGLTGKNSAWHASSGSSASKVDFICPVPGYDRHYAVCEHLGINMITVPMTPEGPDMNAVEALVTNNKNIRGMWCVPKYSNPTGAVYSDAVVQRIAQLGNIAHPDFRVFWDNAYAMHDLNDHPQQLSNIFDACRAAGTENSVLQFASTSKITFAGAGVAFIGASEANLTGLKKSLAFITIGPDKVNQLRHAKFFASEGELAAHMKKHAAILQPRFACVLEHLESAFGDNDLGTWETPKGGYFISFDTRPGLAQEVVKLAAEAGVKLTPAGATFPYGKDPQDANIRIAPSVPSVEQVNAAMEVFTLCVKLASLRQALAKTA